MDDELYRAYFKHLLSGDSAACTDIVLSLLENNLAFRTLYIDLFQRSLYEVGELWEHNRISVAREHLATAITDRLMNLVYPKLFTEQASGPRRKAVVTCAPNEFHQIGGKMAADFLEMCGFDTHFMGANLPSDQLLRHLAETRVDVVGISLSIYLNLPSLLTTIASVRNHFGEVEIIVGGQAFRWGGVEAVMRFENTQYISSLDALEQWAGIVIGGDVRTC